MAGVAAGFHSNKAGITPNSTYLISSSSSSINYPVFLLFGWNESLHPHQPFADEIEDPCYSVCNANYRLHKLEYTQSGNRV